MPVKTPRLPQTRERLGVTSHAAGGDEAGWFHWCTATMGSSGGVQRDRVRDLVCAGPKIGFGHKGSPVRCR
jgi:hypothetical protein